MDLRPGHVVLLVAIGATAAFAVLRASSSPPVPAQAAVDAGSLPPSHPPIPSGARPPSGNEAPALAWTVPGGWSTAPNTSTMRLATYHVPAAKGEADETEVTVVRAGGTVEANIDRWVRQFDEAGKDERTVKTVAGLKITFVEVSGSYLGGAMAPQGAPEPRKGWSLLAAIVETPGSPYFFKMLGPTATVKAARETFFGLLDSVTPR